MDKILELREKRAKLWEQAKAFLDSHRDKDALFSPEDTATYDKMEADVVNMGKEIDRLERQAAIDREMNAPTTTPILNRPEAAKQGEEKKGRASAEYRKGFWDVIRNRPTSPDTFNALQVGTDSEGGYLVPDEFEKTLVEALEEQNVIRSLANPFKTSSGERKIPVAASNGTASWVEEEEETPESDDTFGQISIGSHKLVTMIKVSEELINDSVFDIESYIAKEFGRRMGRAEEKAFISGNGIGKPTGILTSVQIGVTAAAEAAIKADEIIDLYYSLKSPYRRNAVFLTNDDIVKQLRKLKDSNGQYIWQPSLTAGTPDTLLNRPLYTSPDMPACEAGAKPVLFGDLSYYWIADRQGRSFKRLGELYAKTGQVGFRATQRVDGKLVLPESIKALQMKAAAAGTGK